MNVAAPFGGSSHTAFNLLIGSFFVILIPYFIYAHSGDDQKFAGISMLKAIYIRDFVRSIASPAILMPRSDAFNSSYSFIEIGQNSAFHYGLDKIEEFFWLTNSSHLLPIYRDHSISHNGDIPAIITMNRIKIPFSTICRCIAFMEQILMLN